MECFRDFKYTIYRTVILDIYAKEWLAKMYKINDIRIGLDEIKSIHELEFFVI